MNHPQQIITKARSMLLAGERVFYCKFDPNLMFSASEGVSKDLSGVVFVTVRTSSDICGMIHPSALEHLTPLTAITPMYLFKDFIEIDRSDPSVWED